MTLAEEEDTQKRGTVLVIFLDSEDTNREVLIKSSATLGSLPVRNDANHMCLSGDDPRVKTLESTLKYFSGQFSRPRIRSHYGKLVFGGIFVFVLRRSYYLLAVYYRVR